MVKSLIVGLLLTLAINGVAYPQGRRHQVYGQNFSGGQSLPGLSVYPGGYYSADYGAQRMWYHRGYMPMQGNYGVGQPVMRDPYLNGYYGGYPRSNNFGYGYRNYGYGGYPYAAGTPEINPFHPYWFNW